MLGGQHNGINTVRLAMQIFDGDLTLGIRAQPRQATIFAQQCLTLNDAVRKVDRQWHQSVCFIAGVTEHQALVARALIEVVV